MSVKNRIRVVAISIASSSIVLLGVEAASAGVSWR